MSPRSSELASHAAMGSQPNATQMPMPPSTAPGAVSPQGDNQSGCLSDRCRRRQCQSPTDRDGVGPKMVVSGVPAGQATLPAKRPPPLVERSRDRHRPTRRAYRTLQPCRHRRQQTGRDCSIRLGQSSTPCKRMPPAGTSFPNTVGRARRDRNTTNAGCPRNPPSASSGEGGTLPEPTPRTQTQR